MERIENCFKNLRSNNKKGLVSYTMAYDPDYATSFEALKTLTSNGVDMLEIGMAFSDPMADGTTIQAAGQRALANKSNVFKVLDLVVEYRKHDNKTPIILMGYYNPILQIGVEEFIKIAKQKGVDGVIIVDVPLEEQYKIHHYFKENKFAFINLIAPTTGEKRIKEILELALGFVYIISVTGVTGTKSVNFENISKTASIIKSNSDIPIVSGFGINNADGVKEAAKFSDAVVVGSAIIKKLHQDKNTLADFVKGLKS